MSGSSAQQSSREKPASLRPEVQDKHPALDAHALHDERVIENTFINETSVNEDAYREKMSLVAGFPEGRAILTTYYSHNSPITDIQSRIVDMSSANKDISHYSFTEIRNFELRCSGELRFEYDSESNKSKVNGEAICFPRFTPKVADIFLYELRNGQIGVFRVTSINRLALGQDTYHSITFTMQEYLTPEYRDMLKTNTTVVMYFDKQKFVAGNTALLTSEGFTQKKFLEHVRLEIIEDYMERFYSNEFSTFMRPDGMYDPYVVEYWNKKVSIADTNLRPTQILISVSNYPKTIWAVLTNNPIKNLANVEKNWNTDTYRSTFWGVNITSLLGHKFITIGKEVNCSNTYSIDANGDPILVDALPIFHKALDPDIVKKNVDLDFMKRRLEVYGDEHPFQKCAPHVHSTDDTPTACYPKDCGQCWFHHERPEIPTAPFPILSNDQLRDIFLAINKVEPNTVLSEEMSAKVRGYIKWYREVYPGTLSKTELKELWVSEYGKEPETDTEIASFNAYVESYRSNYLAVLTDRQVEYVFRMERRIPNDRQLTTEELAECILIIVQYRREHGYPDDNSATELGIPLNPSEYGGVMYDHMIMLVPPSATELVNLEYNTINNVEVSFTSNIPHIFFPHFKEVHSSKHCHHDVCHYICGAKAKLHELAKQAEKKKADESHYAFSNEFYLGSAAMDPFERLVYDCIANKELDVAAIVDAVSRYKEWDDEESFYRHLFSIYLIDKALYWLMYH